MKTSLLYSRVVWFAVLLVLATGIAQYLILHGARP